jgi:cytochrome c5
MKTKTIFAAIFGLSLLAPLASFAAAGSSVYDKTCALCHAAGVAGAPKLGNKDDWAPRIAKGVSALYTSALNGTAKGMPAKGGNPALSDADVKAAVDFMVSKVATAKQAKPAAKDTKAAVKEAAKPATAASVAAPAAVAATATPAANVAVNTAAGPAIPFNRLLRPKAKSNLPPAEDGIHDPANDGTLALQPPQQGLAGLPTSTFGNRVDWVQAVGKKIINPRYDRLDPSVAPVVMDLNIAERGVSAQAAHRVAGLLQLPPCHLHSAEGCQPDQHGGHPAWAEVRGMPWQSSIPGVGVPQVPFAEEGLCGDADLGQALNRRDSTRTPGCICRRLA